jgi:hypothetical protein
MARLVPDRFDQSGRDAQRFWPTDDARDHAADSIRDIVLGTRRMVDAVTSPARGPALKGAELRGEPWDVEQFGAVRVQDRQQIAVNIAFRLLSRDVGNAVGARARA